MSWRDKIVKGDAVGGGPWPVRLGRYLSWSAERWPRLAEAIAGLGAVRTREIRVADRTLRIQWNPGRATSSTAKVDTASVAARPCFLCPQNLPPEEVGLAFGPEWAVLPNPAPILPLHLVVAYLDHDPQQVLLSLSAMLGMAEAAEGVGTVVYNGPRCGASAPDHIHFQVVESRLLPEEHYVREQLDQDLLPGKLVHQRPGLRVWEAERAGRVILGLVGRRDPVERALMQAIEALGAQSTDPGEPMLNLLVTAREDELIALLFPRGAHRPAVYFADDPDKRIVSPGVIDMAGLIVTVREQDFEKLDGESVAQILDEVTLPAARRDAWLLSLKQRWSDGG
jgi:hypothetical protein